MTEFSIKNQPQQLADRLETGECTFEAKSLLEELDWQQKLALVAALAVAVHQGLVVSDAHDPSLGELPSAVLNTCDEMNYREMLIVVEMLASNLAAPEVCPVCGAEETEIETGLCEDCNCALNWPAAISILSTSANYFPE